MPRRKLTYLPGRERAVVNCFAYYADRNGAPKCRALADIFCLKTEMPCPFFATPEAAAIAQRRARRRLAELDQAAY